MYGTGHFGRRYCRIRTGVRAAHNNSMASGFPMTDQNIAGPEGLSVDRLHEPGLDPAAYVFATHGSPVDQDKSVERLRRMYEQFAAQPVPERLLSLLSAKV